MKSLFAMFVTLAIFSTAHAVSVQCVTFGGDSKGSTQNFESDRSVRSKVGVLNNQDVVIYATTNQLYLSLEVGGKSYAFSSNSNLGGDSSENKEVKLQEITEGSGVGGKNIVCTRQ